jgi:hypothetical protein
LGDAFNVHGQLESLRFKRVKKKTTALHGKQIRYSKAFTIPHQWLTPKTQGNFRLESEECRDERGFLSRACRGLSFCGAPNRSSVGAKLTKASNDLRRGAIAPATKRRLRSFEALRELSLYTQPNSKPLRPLLLAANERVDAAYGAQERFLHEVVRTVDFATECDRERAQARNGSQHGVTHGWLKRISSVLCRSDCREPGRCSWLRP